MNTGLMQLGNSLLSYEKQLAVIANNMANLNTDRFKNDTTVIKSFKDFYVEEVNDNKKTQHLSHEVFTSFTQGVLEKSADNNELAIDGKGFLQVAVGNTQMLFRGGKVSGSLEGYLVDDNGNQLIGVDGGPIRVQGNDFTITADGSVIQGEVVTGRIRVVNVENEGALTKAGGEYYLSANNIAYTDSNSKLRQGFVERSNADMSNEYLRMMALSRLYETNQKIIQVMDEINGKAVNEIGRLY